MSSNQVKDILTIYNHIRRKPRKVKELATKTGIPAYRIKSALKVMESAGNARCNFAGRGTTWSVLSA